MKSSLVKGHFLPNTANWMTTMCSDFMCNFNSSCRFGFLKQKKGKATNRIPLTRKYPRTMIIISFKSISDTLLPLTIAGTTDTCKTLAYILRKTKVKLRKQVPQHPPGQELTLCIGGQKNSLLPPVQKKKKPKIFWKKERKKEK